MWTKVAKRSHKPLRVFPFPMTSSASGEGQELMLHGTVSYVLKEGDKAVNDVPWAARATVVKEGDKVRMSAYHVYLDSAAMVPKN